MGKKEITVLALASALLVTVHTVPVSAAEAISAFSMQTALAQLIPPRWGSTNMVVPSISLSGKKISASVVIDPKESTTTSVGTLHLDREIPCLIVATFRGGIRCFTSKWRFLR